MRNSNTVLNISKAGDLAFHAMMYLAGNQGKAASSQEISKKLGASVHHLSKVMKRLVENRLIHSSPGAGGGFTLALPPEKINFLQIYEIFEGKYTLDTCLHGDTRCLSGDFKNCILGGSLVKLNQKVLELLERTTLEEFAVRETVTVSPEMQRSEE